jgi:hypothetical protein
MQPLKSWEQVAFNNRHLSGEVTESLLTIRALGASFDETNDAAQWPASPLKSAIDYVLAKGNEHDYALGFVLVERRKTPRLYILQALCSWAERRTDQGHRIVFDWQKALLKEADYWRQKSEIERKAKEANTQSHVQQTMTRDEAEIIFRDWQAYVEINDKLFQIFGPSIPKSFLPYPPDVLEKAMNIIASGYFEAGDGNTCTMIQENISAILSYKDDEEAIKNIVNGVRLKHVELRKIFIGKLQKSRDSWAKLRGYKPGT